MRVCCRTSVKNRHRSLLSVVKKSLMLISIKKDKRKSKNYNSQVASYQRLHESYSFFLHILSKMRLWTITSNPPINTCIYIYSDQRLLRLCAAFYKYVVFTLCNSRGRKWVIIKKMQILTKSSSQGNPIAKIALVQWIVIAKIGSNHRLL